MDDLDFSSQSSPAPAAPDFSSQSAPVTKVSALENLGRQFVAGGGDLLNTIGSLGDALLPAPGLSPAAGAKAVPVTPGAGAGGLADALGIQAQTSQALQPNEAADGLVSRVAGGVGRTIPSLAAAIGTGGEGLAGLVPDAAKSIPVVGNLLTALAGGAGAGTALNIQHVANASPDETTGSLAKDAAINYAMAGLPGAVGTNPLLRTASGAAIGGGLAAGSQYLDGQQQDAATNIVGALTGAALAGAHPGDLAMDPHLKAYEDSSPFAPAASRAELPAGADFTSESKPVKPSLQLDGPNGPVAVTPAGEAFTPAQGAQTLGDALAAAQARAAPAELPAPAIVVTPQGDALTTSDQNAALQPPPPDPQASLLQALGLTPGTLAAQANDPRTAREGAPIVPPAPLGLPAPVTTVDSLGNASTSADFLANLQAAQAMAENNANLGLTPDIQRVQALAQSRAANAAPSAELSTQGEDDSPPWWLAGQHADDQETAARSLQNAPSNAPDASSNGLQASSSAPAAPAPAPAEQTAITPQGLTKPGAPPAVQQVANHQAKAAQGELVQNPRPPSSIDLLRSEIGWDQKGGKLLRAAGDGTYNPMTDGAGNGAGQGEVVGRTPWVGKAGPDGESSFWRDRPREGGALSEAQADAAMDKYAAGQPLNTREQRFIDHAHATQDRYDAAYEADKQQFEQDRADMTADQIAHAQRTMRMAKVKPEDIDEALTLNELVSRAMDAGVSTSDILDATFDGTQAEAARKLWDLTRKANDNGNESTDVQQRGEAGDRPQNARVAAAGSARSEAVPGAADRASDQPPAGNSADNGPQSGAVVREPGGLFADPTPAERLKAETERRDAQRNGLGRDLVRPEQGDGDLLAGHKPQQSEIPPADDKVESSSRDLFASYKPTPATPENMGDGQPHMPADLRRPDWTPQLESKAWHAIDGLVEKLKGSKLADAISEEMRTAGAASLIGKTVNSHDDLAAIAGVYRNPAFETMRYIYVNKDGKVIGETAVSSRLPSSSAIFPQGSGHEFVEGSAPVGATGVWLSHNHPSGNPQPSGADLQATGAMYVVNGDKAGAPKVLGHVVTDHDTYGAISADGRDLGVKKVPGVTGPDPLRTPSGSMQNYLGAPAQSVSEASRVAKGIFDGVENGSSAVIILDNKLKVVSALSIPNDQLATTKGAAILLRIGQKRGTVAMILVAKTADIDQYKEAMKASVRRNMFTDIVEMTPSGAVLSHARAGNMQANYFGSHSKAWQKRQGASGGVQVYEDQSFDKPTFTQDVNLPHRNPGESQADYAARVLVKTRDQIKAATELAKLQQKIGRYEIRGMAAHNARQMDIADAAMKEIAKSFDKTPDVINFASVHQWETEQPIADADFRKFAAVMQKGFDQRIAEIHRVAPGALESLITNYMPHLYKDSSKALSWYQNAVGKTPMQGDKSFLKQRTWPTLKEAMASGLEPISPNPVDWVLAKYAQMDKFIGALQLKQNFADRGWLMRLAAGQKPPPGFARVDDPAFQIAGGLQGSYALPELIAKDLNNYLAPGLSKYAAVRSLRAVQNAMVSANLGWSAFHAGFTSIDNAVTHGAVGLQRLAIGDITGGLTALVKAVPTMLTSPFEGGKLNQQWSGQKAMDPNTAALLEALEQGGARKGMSSATADYNNALPKVMRTIRRMQAPGALADRIDDAKNFAAANTPLHTAGAGLLATAKGAGNVISAIGEVSSFLIHHVLVPNQKMAARVTLLKFELDRMAGVMNKAGVAEAKMGDYAKLIDLMHPDVVKQLASDVVDKVDFRLGHMAYDNFFYPKIAREVSQMLVMAPGWQAGAFQTMTGGIKDLGRFAKPEKLVAPLDKAGKITNANRGLFTNNTANLIMLFMMVGGANAALQYMMSGEAPDEALDYVAPRTGRKNADGSDERLTLPSYMKDHYEFFHHPVDMASHKLHPLLREMWELAHNSDYFGNEIRNPKAPAMKQAEQLAGYLIKGMLPFSATNIAKAKDTGASPGRMAANFVGVVDAPASMSRSKFQQFVAKGGDAGWDYPASTPEQADYRNKMTAAENAMRTGTTPDLSGLTDRDVSKLEKKVQTEKPQLQFDRLGIEDKLDAYDLATPAERKQYNLAEIITSSKWAHSAAAQRMPDDERQQIEDKIEAIRSAGDQ